MPFRSHLQADERRWHAASDGPWVFTPESIESSGVADAVKLAVFSRIKIVSQ
jgi:hypothetical protein